MTDSVRLCAREVQNFGSTRKNLMSLPNRNNPYSFDAFLERRDSADYYTDNPLFERLVRRYAGSEADAIHPRLLAFSALASGRWRDLAEINGLPENRPYLTHYDGHGHRIDRIVRPAETLILEREIFSAGVFSARTPRWERLAKLLILTQNGEHGVSCAMACTEGMLALLEAFIETAHPEVKRIWHACKEGEGDEFGSGSQFLTEIQGGSDVQANVVEAVPADDHYSLYGVKFFCSACHTDYAIVTAKVTGQEDVSTFVVPAWLTPEDKRNERRNGYVIRRLKQKLGTIELPTAEIEYQGAVAYPVGPLGAGVANVVGHVLTTSRMHVSINNAATSLRAAREAKLYADFREVFSRAVADYPLGAANLADIQWTADRTLAGLFKVYNELLELGGGLTAGLPRDPDIGLRKRKFALRILIMLQKITTSRDAIQVLHDAISLHAGHGVMECFSALPRLLRDAFINEQWEGPRNLLLSQIHNDLRRVVEWYPPEEVVRDILAGADEHTLRELMRLTPERVNTDLLEAAPSDESMDFAREWDRFCEQLFHAYQDAALRAVS